MRKSQEPRMFCLKLQQGHHRLLSKLFSVQGCSADGEGEGKGLEAGGLNPASTPLAKPCAQCKIMSVQGRCTFLSFSKGTVYVSRQPPARKNSSLLTDTSSPKGSWQEWMAEKET